MSRPRRVGRIFFQPEVTYFKPAGIRMIDLAETILTFEELEAVRMIDYEEKEQAQVAKKMKISQPTLSRLLTSARKKLADAIINGKAIKIHGGIYKMATPRRGRMGGLKAAGPGGNCVCLKCGKKVKHKRANPCFKQKCPECGAQMTRE